MSTMVDVMYSRVAFKRKLTSVLNKSVVNFILAKSIENNSILFDIRD